MHFTSDSKVCAWLQQRVPVLNNLVQELAAGQMVPAWSIDGLLSLLLLLLLLPPPPPPLPPLLPLPPPLLLLLLLLLPPPPPPPLLLLAGSWVCIWQVRLVFLLWLPHGGITPGAQEVCECMTGADVSSCQLPWAGSNRFTGLPSNLVAVLW
jgi:hypothetical protein